MCNSLAKKNAVSRWMKHGMCSRLLMLCILATNSSKSLFGAEHCGIMFAQN